MMIGSFFTAQLLAQEKSKEKTKSSKADNSALQDAVVETYKTIGDVSLKVFIFNPKDHKPGDQRPAIVFFFGGGWKAGDPKQFSEHCKYLADRGMVAMTADYRVESRQHVKVIECVADAKSAIRWARANAERLGIDPEKIAAGGGSAGGHLAACTGVVPGFEGTDEPKISSRPNALVLFNPALVLDSVEGEEIIPQTKIDELRGLIGTEPKNVSPYHHAGQGAPPTIIFHGKTDQTVPYRTAEIFTQRLTKAGSNCELVGFENKTHGFFNFGRGDNSDYQATIQAMDNFLTKLGWIAPL